MIQLMSRAGNFSSAVADEAHGPRPPAADAPRTVRPALRRNPRRSTRELLLIPCSCRLREPSRVTIRSVRRGQPDPEALLERIPIQEVCQCNVLRDKARGVDQDALIVALPALLRADDQLLDLRMELLAREQAAFDHPLEFALQHVELPAVDDNLVQLRPAGRIELAARQRDEGAARLEPGLAAHHLARRGAADGDVGVTHHLLDRILRDYWNPQRLRPLLRESSPRFGLARGAADLVEPVHGGQTPQGIRAHGADADEAEHLRIPGPDPFAGDGRSGGAADGIAPVLVDDRNRLAAARVRQHDVARAAEAADRVARAIVEVIVDPDAGRRDVLQEDGLHMPMVV